MESGKKFEAWGKERDRDSSLKVFRLQYSTWI